MAADGQLLQAVEALWRTPPPGPDNLLSDSAFVALSSLCGARYGGADPGFALSTALRSLGLPCLLRGPAPGAAPDAAAAAEALDLAFRRRTTRRRHLCPLDLADVLPTLAFGSARVAQFRPADLEALFDAAKLRRNYPALPFEAARLSQFQWLVVEEDVAVDARAEARAMPFLFTDMRRDLGEIEPHLGRFPSAVEAALFFLLLAPWEDWARMPEVDWRGFRTPWIYTADEDLFVRPGPPPSADSLTLQPWFVDDDWGDPVELEPPAVLDLDEEAGRGLSLFTDDAWRSLDAALATSLFETPIRHFLVRAFLTDGMDEIMAHMTAVEAALGLRADHQASLRPKPDPYKGMSSTERVAARVAGLLGDPASAEAFRELFTLRSDFVHGRQDVPKVPTPVRVSARRLARRVARALVDLAEPRRAREDVLTELLDRGTRLP